MPKFRKTKIMIQNDKAIFNVYAFTNSLKPWFQLYQNLIPGYRILVEFISFLLS